ncbi:acyltransferase family protein [Anatilimnocola sp. NA78]|uniref:acyltransferase family protein n=1 Tax=Anatilimnocola sp. NA78 TaxID=3415683 RepID=UPI003CE5ABFD
MSTLVLDSPADVISAPGVRAEKKPAPAPSRFYRPELDGLRFFSFLAVFLSHAHLIKPQQFAGQGPVMAQIGSWLMSLSHLGYPAVAVFFVLSSYLITELLLREHERTGTIDIRAFYARRALRIWPLYYCFLISTFFIERWIGMPGIPVGQMPWYLAFLGNWQIVTTGTIPRSAAQLLWTVAIEEQFYMVWPLLLVLISPKRLVWACVALIVAGQATRIYLWQTQASFFAIHFNTFVQFDSIAWGGLLAIATRRGWLDHLSAATRWGLMGLGLLIALFTEHYLAGSRPFAAWAVFAYPLFALAALAIVAGAMRSQAQATSWLTHPWLLHWGKISYGLYIWHILAIFLVYKFGWCPPRSSWTALYALPLTFGLAELSYYWIEKPFLRWKDRFARVDSRPADETRQPAVAEI